MRKKELSRGQYRVYLDRYEYRTLLHNAASPVAALTIRLSGEVGLKVSEATNVRLSDVEKSSTSDDFHFLYVPLTEDDEDLDYARGRPRRAYLPPNLHEFMHEFVEANGMSHDEKLIQVTKRTTQEYVKRSAEAAAQESGKDDFELVSSLDLRIFFAKQAIERWRIHPRVVMKVGGWSDMKTLLEHLDAPTETKIIREFDRARSEGMDKWMSETGPRPKSDNAESTFDEFADAH